MPPDRKGNGENPERGGHQARGSWAEVLISGKRTKGGVGDIEPIAQHGINTWLGDGVPLFA